MSVQTKKKQKVFLFLAIFCIVGCIVGVSERNILMIVVYIALTVLFIYLWNTKKKSIPETPQIPENVSIEHNKIIVETKKSKPEITPTDYITKNFRVAGVSYRQEEIQSLGCINPDYSLTKKELMECHSDGDKVYKYDFYIDNVILEPEPTNTHDPNAIKVIADNTHIGYIKQGKCSEVRNLLNSEKKLSIDIEIHGGPYKELYCTEDDTYEIEKGSYDFSATVSILYHR